MPTGHYTPTLSSHEMSNYTRQSLPILHRFHTRPLLLLIGCPLGVAILPWLYGRGTHESKYLAVVSPPAHSGVDGQSVAVRPDQVVYYEPHQGDPLAHVDVTSLLHALADVESLDDDSVIGIHGERGAYQFRRDTWENYSGGLSFKLATSRVYSSYVAKRYLSACARILLDHKRPVTADNLARLWHDGTLMGPASTYAERTLSLYNDYAQCPEQVSNATK
jgi:hypothetical protein